jgi:selenocysteine-specific elongation factor
VLGLLAEAGTVGVERDKVRLGGHEIRLSGSQQAALDRMEKEFRDAEAAPPSAEEALSRAGLAGGEDNELFQMLLESRRLVRVKESLFFHTAALEAIQDKLVALLRERKEIGPGDIKDLLGISRKYAIPLLEYFDARRVTTRVGERRVLRGG